MAVEKRRWKPGQGFRHAVGIVVDVVAYLLGVPRTFVSRAEFVGTIPRPIGEFEALLDEAGYSWDPLSLYHHKPEGRRGDGSFTYRDGLLADRQLHLILYAYDDRRVDLFAHEEDNWIRHPIGHLRKRDIDRVGGARRVQEWLDRADIEYYRAERWGGLTHVLPNRIREIIYGERAP